MQNYVYLVDLCPRFQYLGMGRVQDFRDSVHNTWELQGSHFGDLDFPHADEKRDPTLKRRAVKAISISQWALDPESLMGNVCWFPGVT